MASLGREWAGSHFHIHPSNLLSEVGEGAGPTSLMEDGHLLLLRGVAEMEILILNWNLHCLTIAKPFLLQRHWLLLEP